MTNTYDFYKPRLDSEYPEVDGPVSVTTYTSALDAAYSRFREKTAKAKKTQLNGHANGNGVANGKEGSSFSINDIDFAIFHSPYGKQVQKGFGRLFYNDFLANPSAPQFANIPNPESVLATSYTASLTDKNLEKTFIGASKATYAKKVEPGMACSKRLGNMYTGSLYGCLASVLSSVAPSELQGKRLSMFAFGSGCAASFFTLRVKGDTSEIREKMDLLARLASMKLVPCQEYVDALTVSPAYSFLKQKLIARSTAPREEPQRCELHPRGLRREYLAWSILPRERGQQVPPQVRTGTQSISGCRPGVFTCMISVAVSALHLRRIYLNTRSSIKR